MMMSFMTAGRGKLPLKVEEEKAFNTFARWPRKVVI